MNCGKELIARPTSSAALAQEYDFVAAAKSGDPLAFEALCKQSADRLFRIARRMMRTREDAEDVVQESFQQAFVHLESFKGDSRFSTWLCRIAMNAALMRLRRSRSRSELSLDEWPDFEERFRPLAIGHHNVNPEQIYSARERQQILSMAVNELTPRMRKAIRLCALQERSTAEVARIMGVSIGAVKAQLFHARKKLLRSLERKFCHSQTEHLQHGSHIENGLIKKVKPAD
jgi:RNA polymerase sigma-70 factor, ECF subfamily